MCEFLSAVKTTGKNGKDKYYFLTYNLIHNTPTGKLLQKKYGGEDLIGHSAIREYFALDDKGKNWECSDFSKPSNFPSVLVQAIKNGEFRGFGTPEGLLAAEAYKRYQEAKAEPYKRYQEATAEADKRWQEATAEADKRWQEATAEADKRYQEAKATVFWGLFMIPENRNPMWR